MEKIMKMLVFALVILSLAGLNIPSAWAFTDDDLRTMQQQIQNLQKAHEEDQTQIQQLKQKLEQTERQAEETQKAANETQKKVEETQKDVKETAQTAAAAVAATKLQPIHPIPSEAMETHNLTLVGDAEVQYVKTGAQYGSFIMADFAPIFLFRSGDNVLCEAGFDTSIQNQAGGGASTNFSLSFAQLDYLFNDYVTFVGGLMQLPLGTYSERSAGWINKLPDDPLPRAELENSGVGVQLRGARSVGDSGQMVTYSIYGVNGPSSVNGTGDENFSLDLKNGGAVHNLDLSGNVVNQRRSPSGGGRIGWFCPLKAHYDIEIGVSGQTGEWSNEGSQTWSAGVVDASIHISPYFETKGEYIFTREETSNIGTLTPQGWWIQAAYKLAGLNLEIPIIPNTELVTRYDMSSNGLGTNEERYTAGLVYYITNTLQFKSAFEYVTSTVSQQGNNQMLLQLSYGF